MDAKKNIDVTEEYKTLMEDPSQINNMSAETLRAISDLIREQERLNSNNSSSVSKGNVLAFTNPYYRGEETRTNNTFNRRIDGYAGPIVLASITVIFGLIFMLIVFNF